MKYEDINNDENIAHYFEDLSINMHNDYMLEFESFNDELE